MGIAHGNDLLEEAEEEEEQQLRRTVSAVLHAGKKSESCHRGTKSVDGAAYTKPSHVLPHRL